MDKDMNLSDLNVNLSKKELTEIDYLNNTSNTISNNLRSKSNPMNLTITDFIKRWADVNIELLIDITNFISNLD